jgi:hypothetical protein
MAALDLELDVVGAGALARSLEAMAGVPPRLTVRDGNAARDMVLATVEAQATDSVLELLDEFGADGARSAFRALS